MKFPPIEMIVCVCVLIAFLAQLWRNIISSEPNAFEFGTIDMLLFVERCMGTIAKAGSVVWFLALVMR